MAWSWRYGWIFKTNPMKKVMICLAGCLLFALTTLRAQDTTRPAPDPARPAVDTTSQASDTAKMMTLLKDSGVVKPAATPAGDTAGQPKDSVISLVDPPADPKSSAAADSKNGAAADSKNNAPAKTSDTTAKAQDGQTDQQSTPQTRQLDTRWFISPLLKLQFQDFAMLEKNREGYLSNANTLPFFARGNASFAASAYKNVTSRLSFSADLGLSFGHVTSNSVEISQTQSKTYNLLAAAIYYHLLPASYRLQPYVSVGFNDIINDASYVTIPIGIGAKFNSKKVMVLAQVSYGEAIGKNIANTTMYSMGVYIPINSKKHKQLDNDDNKPYNRPDKDDAKKKDKDTTAGKGIVVNVNVTINMDSVLKAKGLLNDDGSPKGRGDDDGQYASDGSGHGKKRRGGLRNFDVNDFEDNDYKMDSLDGRPIIRFVVYFEFNDYGLNDKAFSNIDRVIGHLKRTPNEFTVEIKGYTDSVGNDHFNNWLSRERAKMVLSYMNSRGIPVELMKAKAYGKDDPVADNADPNKAWLNRRAEIIVHAKEALANGQ
jgi:outer membrane protein OmpA-like peptidoglycan-associated protein